MLPISAFFLCLIVSVVATKEVYSDPVYDVDTRDVYPLWPSKQSNGKDLWKRQAPLLPGQGDITTIQKDPQPEVKPKETGALQESHSEGGTLELKLTPTIPTAVNTTLNQTVSSSASPKTDIGKGNTTEHQNGTSSAVPSSAEKPINATVPKAPSYQADLSNPGVLKRGLIVFGGFALMAIAYFIFYRRKSKNNDSNNTHGTSDTNQFRYGVLESDDRRDNLELSRILTVESDEDEDEDLEIFDLEQKKKSLSYVNLQTSDDYVVHGSRENDVDMDNLLLDIEDVNSDTLINWSSSSNNNKSIL